MNIIILSYKKSLLLLTRHWQIFAIFLLFSVRPMINLFIRLPSLIMLIIICIELGWFGTSFEFIKAAYQKNTLPWNQFGGLIVKYIKKLFPFALVLILIATVLGVIGLIYYGNWYLGGTGLSPDESVQKQQIFDIFNSLGNPVIFQRFIGQFMLIAVVIQHILSVLSFVGTITLTILVVEGHGVLKSFLKSFSFIKNHFIFFVVGIIIFTVLSTITGRILPLFGIEWISNPYVYTLLAYSITLPGRFIYVIIEAATVIYYLETRKGLKK